MGLHRVNAKSEFENLCNFTKLPVTLHRKMAELGKQEKHRNTKIFNLIHAQPEKNKYTA
jgi:hypothetical protein